MVRRLRTSPPAVASSSSSTSTLLAVDFLGRSRAEVRQFVAHVAPIVDFLWRSRAVSFATGSSGSGPSFTGKRKRRSVKFPGSQQIHHSFGPVAGVAQAHRPPGPAVPDQVPAHETRFLRSARQSCWPNGGGELGSSSFQAAEPGGSSQLAPAVASCKTSCVAGCAYSRPVVRIVLVKRSWVTSSSPLDPGVRALPVARLRGCIRHDGPGRRRRTLLLQG